MNIDVLRKIDGVTPHFRKVTAKGVTQQCGALSACRAWPHSQVAMTSETFLLSRTSDLPYCVVARTSDTDDLAVQPP
jgi:hypothetical protein